MLQHNPGEGLPISPSHCRGALLTDGDPVPATSGLGNKNKHRWLRPRLARPDWPGAARDHRPRRTPNHGAGRSKVAKRKQRLQGLGAGMHTASLAAGGEELSLPLLEEEEEVGAFLMFSHLVTPQPIHQVIYS